MKTTDMKETRLKRADLTPKHHRNSQIHCMPMHDKVIKHTSSLDCPCNPTLSMLNGHIMVDHKASKGTADKWSMRVANSGKKVVK